MYSQTPVFHIIADHELNHSVLTTGPLPMCRWFPEVSVFSDCSLVKDHVRHFDTWNRTKTKNICNLLVLHTHTHTHTNTHTHTHAHTHTHTHTPCVDCFALILLVTSERHTTPHFCKCLHKHRGANRPACAEIPASCTLTCSCFRRGDILFEGGGGGVV